MQGVACRGLHRVAVPQRLHFGSGEHDRAFDCEVVRQATSQGDVRGNLHGRRRGLSVSHTGVDVLDAQQAAGDADR